MLETGTPYLQGFCATYLDWHVRAGDWLYAPLTSIIASVFMCVSLVIMTVNMARNYRAAYDYQAVSLFTKRPVVQVLPVYFWFAQLVSFWFTLTALSLFLPYESPAAQVTGHIVYVGHGFMDNFLIVLGFFRSTDAAAIRTTVMVVVLICTVKAVLLICYSSRDLACGWCSTFFPIPQAGYMDMALAVAYLAIIAAAIIPGCEKYRPRSTILPWTCFMAVGYTTVSIAALLNMAHMDAGLCVESAAVYIYASGYAFVLYICFMKDSRYWHGFDNRLLNGSRDAAVSPMSRHAASALLTAQPTAQSIKSALQKLKELRVTVIPWRQLTLGPRLGSGGFGEVFRGEWRSTPVAIKRLYPLPTAGINGATRDRQTKALELLVAFGSEVSIMQQMRHPNIVLLMGVSATRAGDLVMITEFMAKGSVFDVMATTGSPLDLYATARVGLHTCRGMSHLHGSSPKVIHRDLKCANLLLDENWVVKCADFGLSRELMSAASTRVGSVQWAAPEILRGEKYTESCDVFSFGICMWECLAGQVPYAGKSAVAVVTMVGSLGPRLTLPRPRSSTHATAASAGGESGGGVATQDEVKADATQDAVQGDPDPTTAYGILHRIFRTCVRADPGKRPTFPQLVAAFELIMTKVSPTPLP